ncbi:sigma-70 family RNA polymerase sigma factor [Dactylosporangium matsuzakiense]|uniref:RNA polymerase sigma factor n=2 Tax=Dactylosporangium matsuzakiense TaxID=53360 RepID=A0A9W6KBL6_9ACTN|nr:RNA polymerase subunit sigma-70 [Dactylosporangium matsuzakiense]GLK98522.1 RNA polymerase sigma factor [Dactylosporangium matsuzakiense]
MTVMSVLDRARGGDTGAFAELVEPFRRELFVHCYRMLGSVQDAEDVLQETLTSAWRGLGGFAGRASVRTWLYRIATNRCLNWLRDAGRARPGADPAARADLPAPTRTGETIWLQPIPDALLEGLPDDTPGPEARYERREAVSLAFVAAVQSLPPRQRAVLLLRDVLGYRAAEAADLLGVTEDAANALLKRARSISFERPAAEPGGAGRGEAGRGEAGRAGVGPLSARQRLAASRFADAIEAGDVDAMVALLTDDAWLTMPPAPFEYQGRAAIAEFFRHVGLADGRRRYRLVPAGANWQPAYGCYVSGRAHGLLVITMRGELVSAFTRFLDNATLPYFGLPRSL